MKSYRNIESKKSPFGNHYVGYSADGRSWRISGSSGNWSAYANVTKQGSLRAILMCDRLSEISKELEAVT